MNIYIDEAGVFIVPSGRSQFICCLLALVIPSSQEAGLFYDFLRLRDEWPHPAVEIKGSSLNESQIAAVVECLRSRDTLVQFVAIDMARHADPAISAFKEAQAARLTKNLTAAHYPRLVGQIRDLQARWLSLPNQLFVQTFMTIVLIRDILQVTTLYYSQRLPQELGHFHWVIDAKDKKTTKMESVWTSVVLPILETQGLSEPLTLLKGTDYSHFKRFLIDETTAADGVKRHIDWLKQQAGHTEAFSGVDIRPIMEEDRQFASSRDMLGLQLADIAVNAFYRTLNGTLQPQGWHNLGTLLIARPPAAAIHFIELAMDPRERSGVRLVDHPMAEVVRQLEGKARSIWSQ